MVHLSCFWGRKRILWERLCYFVLEFWYIFRKNQEKSHRAILMILLNCLTICMSNETLSRKIQPNTLAHLLSGDSHWFFFPHSNVIYFFFLLLGPQSRLGTEVLPARCQSFLFRRLKPVALPLEAHKSSVPESVSGRRIRENNFRASSSPCNSPLLSLKTSHKTQANVRIRLLQKWINSLPDF